MKKCLVSGCYAAMAFFFLFSSFLFLLRPTLSIINLVTTQLSLVLTILSSFFCLFKFNLLFAVFFFLYALSKIKMVVVVVVVVTQRFCASLHVKLHIDKIKTFQFTHM